MKKTLLIVFSLPASLLFFQGCKKSDTATTTPTSTAIFEASIGGNDWTPDTTLATITYNTAFKTKTLSLMGVKSQKEIDMSVNDTSPADNASFTTGTYNDDGSSDEVITYSTQQKNASGQYVFQPFGVVEAGSGSVSISSIDTVKRTISGSYNFTVRHINYDNAGNIVSIDIVAVTGGVINSMPYVLKRE